MPQPNKIPLAFAASGDKNTIPESTETTGLASWREGFPAITSAPFSEGGIAPKRADFNGIFNALSLATVWQQQGGFYAYDTTTDYEIGNVVEYSGDLYKCITANGPSSAVKAPTDTLTWGKLLDFSAVSQTAAANKVPLADASGLIGDYIGTKTESNSTFNASYKRYKLKLSNGLMILSDLANGSTNADSRVEITYEEAFVTPPIVIFSSWLVGIDYIYTNNASRFIVNARSTSGAALAEGTNRVYGYIALGRWK